MFVICFFFYYNISIHLIIHINIIYSIHTTTAKAKIYKHYTGCARLLNGAIKICDIVHCNTSNTNEIC